MKILIVKNYGPKKNGIITVIPPFEQIEYIDAITMEEEDVGVEARYSQEFHLDGVQEEIKDVYYAIINKLLLIYPNLTVNPQKYYISLRDNKNFSFIHVRKKKIRMVVRLEEKRVREILKKHVVVHLRQSVQDFWNGPSCEIIIENNNNLLDLIKVLKEAKEKQDKND